jgi:hypothetical protein
VTEKAVVGLLDNDVLARNIFHIFPTFLSRLHSQTALRWPSCTIGLVCKSCLLLIHNFSASLCFEFQENDGL